MIAGNFRGDRHAHGPKVEIALPPCPPWLGKTAQRHWQELGPELVRAGLLSAIDGDLFAAHCDTAEKFEHITRKLKRLKSMMASTPQGFLVQSTLFTIRNKLLEQLVKTGREFGLTPAARSAIKSPAQGQLPLGSGWDEM